MHQTELLNVNSVETATTVRTTTLMKPASPVLQAGPVAFTAKRATRVPVGSTTTKMTRPAATVREQPIGTSLTVTNTKSGRRATTLIGTPTSGKMT